VEVAPVGTLDVGVRMAPGGRVPPTGGGWWLYHSFSTQFTTLAPPLLLAHSASRALNELPRAGFKSAPPNEKVSQIMNTMKAKMKPAKTWRRRRVRRNIERE